MSIRSLLLGSTAALAAVSGANAADAIVATAPEPLEYVRICDAYGAGYFFIPGSETCLKIGGVIRTEGKWYDAYNVVNKPGTLWHTRSQLTIDTATDTEYGALKTDAILRFDFTDGVESQKLLWANISLGGFLIGKSDSQYNYWFGYAGSVINDDVIYDGPYELNQVTYTYNASGDGFTAVASLEDTNSGSDSFAYGGAWQKGKANHYAPDGVLGLGYRAGKFGFKVIGGYDSIAEEGAIKARIDADFGVFKAFLMAGWNTDGSKLNKYAGSNQNISGCPVGRGDLCGWGDWAVWGGASIPVNPKLTGNFQLAYSDTKIFEATANVQFKPVKNLVITPELAYVNYDSIKAHTWAGILRFQRAF